MQLRSIHAPDPAPRRLLPHFLALLLALLGAASHAIAQTDAWKSNIPTSHPRLAVNHPEFWARAHTWHAAHPDWTPSSHTDPVSHRWDPVGNALKYHLTGDTTFAQIGLAAALNGLDAMINHNTHGDQTRWYGESVIIAYDLLHPFMGADDRAYFTANLNAIIATFNEHYWGAAQPEFVENNYYMGFLRNSLLWGIASYHDNPLADGFIDHALVTRWDNLSKPYFNLEAPGGIPSEGLNYGPYTAQYLNLAFETVRNYGRDLYQESGYYRNAVYATLYATPPQPTWPTATAPAAGWSQFIFGDAGQKATAREPIPGAVKTFMHHALSAFDGTAAADYARRWLEQTGYAGDAPALLLAADPGGAPRDFADLPLDYASAGVVGYLYTKNDWGPDATAAFLQLASPAAIGHEHADSGTWQLWRDGVWLSREIPGRAYSGYAITPYGGGEPTTDIVDPLAHNSVLFNGRGVTADIDWNPWPQVRRLESHADYNYSAVDLTPSFQTPDHAEVVHAEREFLFIRALETLVIFDRLESTVPSTEKAFIVHFQGAPIRDANRLTHVNRDQAIDVTTVLPAAPAYRLLDNRLTLDHDGSHRAEIVTSGETLSYFLNVVQARDAADIRLTIALTETATHYELALTHPTKGNARVHFAKGATNSGGAFAYDPAVLPTDVVPFAAGIEKLDITEAGPTWTDTAWDPAEYPHHRMSGDAPSEPTPPPETPTPDPEPTPGDGAATAVVFTDAPARFAFAGGQGGSGNSQVVAGEGLDGSDAINYTDIPTGVWKRINAWDFTAQPLDISGITGSDFLMLSVDIGDASAPLAGVRLYLNGWSWDGAPALDLPQIDNVAGYQTFLLPLDEIRPALGDTITQLHPAHPNWPVSAIRFDEIKFVRPVEIFHETASFEFEGGQGGSGTSQVVPGEGLGGSAAIKYDGIPTNIWKRIHSLDFRAAPLVTGSLGPADYLTVSVDIGNVSAPLEDVVLFINGWSWEGAPAIALPTIDNVAGYQTFYLDLPQSVIDRIVLDGGITRVHPSHPNWPISTLWLDDLLLNGVAQADDSAPSDGATSPTITVFENAPQAFVFSGGQGGAGQSQIVPGEGLDGSDAIKYTGITPGTWQRINALAFSGSALADSGITAADTLTLSIDAGDIAAPVTGVVLNINGWSWEGAPQIALPTIDNVAGYQTFTLPLPQNVVDRIQADGGITLVHPDHGNWPITTLWLDGIRIDRAAP